MAQRAITYVGRRAPVWPIGRGALGIGCATVIWLLMVLGLGLVVFSIILAPWVGQFFLDHAGAVWVAVALASGVWPYLYIRHGWYRTLFGYWPADESEGTGVGPACETCGSLVRRGRTANGHYVCDVCVRQRALDTRRLISPAVVMVGVAFLTNGISSLVDYRLRQASGGVVPSVFPSATGSERQMLQALEWLGALGSIGLAAAGGVILLRIVRQGILRPIGPRALNAARQQIVQALAREAEERRAEVG